KLQVLVHARRAHCVAKPRSLAYWLSLLGSLLSATSANCSPQFLHATGPYPSRRFIVMQTGHGPRLKLFMRASSATTRSGQAHPSGPTQGIAADAGSPPDPTQRSTS